ncbi:MAG: hypothetical protein V8R63_06680 [Thomasclavelia ramosa]
MLMFLYPGEHFVYNALIAIAIGLNLDIPMEQCIQGVKVNLN